MIKIYTWGFTPAQCLLDIQLLFDFRFTKTSVPKLSPGYVTGKSIGTETTTWSEFPISEESQCMNQKLEINPEKKGFEHQNQRFQ